MIRKLEGGAVMPKEAGFATAALAVFLRRLGELAADECTGVEVACRLIRGPEVKVSDYAGKPVSAVLVIRFGGNVHVIAQPCPTARTLACVGCRTPLSEAGVEARITSAPGQPALCESCYDGITP